MRAVSGVFNKIWNCLSPKSRSRIHQLVSEIDRYPPSRPLFTTPQSNQLSPQPASTHPQPSSSPTFPVSPFLFIIICFPDLPLLSSSHRLVFTIVFLTFFRFLCLYLPASSHPPTGYFWCSLRFRLPPAYQAIIVDIIPRGSTSITFSDPSKLALAPNQIGRHLRTPRNSKQYAAWANT
jgi:hypothetical protein